MTSGQCVRMMWIVGTLWSKRGLVGEVLPQEWNLPSRPHKSQPVYGKKLTWEL